MTWFKRTMTNEETEEFALAAARLRNRVMARLYVAGHPGIYSIVDPKVMQRQVLKEMKGQT